MAKSAGRHAWQPTAKDRETVRTMATSGILQADIARVLHVAPKTLRKHCRDELDNAAVVANTAIAQSMFRMATHGPYSVRFQAAKFWLASRMGWKETSLHEFIRPLSEMSSEEIRARLELDDPERRSNIVRFPK
jgi:hypothetical protein